MQQVHTPRVDTRYWTAITMASVFGTNLGDLYAHESGLDIVKGLALLSLLAAVALVIERYEKIQHQVYYWLVIILIRTGATNIADYLAFRVRVPGLALTVGLAGLLCLFGWGTHRGARDRGDSSRSLPKTDAMYWFSMLTAGVFGTVAGDICSHVVGQGTASLALAALLLGVLLAAGGRAAQNIALYWTTVAIARTAGTAIGDWLAENKSLNIGLPLATLATGITFVAVLILWKGSAKESRTLVESS